jgi:hypothetical protein
MEALIFEIGMGILGATLGFIFGQELSVMRMGLLVRRPLLEIGSPSWWPVEEVPLGRIWYIKFNRG